MTVFRRPSPQASSKLRLIGSLVALCLVGVVGMPTAFGAPGAAPSAPGAGNVKPPAPAPGVDPDALGFHDVLPGGAARPIRNDLQGTFTGMVEFAQSHTIAPAGNTAGNMPTLVAQRAALLIVTPSTSTSLLSVTVSVNGVARGVRTLQPPAAMPADDQVDRLGRPDVTYSKRAWSVELPWNWVEPGMSLSFAASGGRTGSLAASGIEVAAPTQLVINGTELGMLTAPPTSAGHTMLNDPARAAADYFETIPVSSLVVAKYEPMQLDKVIVASGAIYESPGTSATTGDVYSGDMRENVAKAQFSTGVNLANFGITSGPMNQVQPSTFNQRVYHHAAGRYTNGVVVHGLSGGNGMATLYDSFGNEWSHELGHSYGLGHYPGTDTTKTGDERVINATHHSESGWGYVASRKRMRSGLWTGAFNPAGVDVGGNIFMQNFAGTYQYNTDAMSGGRDGSEISRYTFHTGYSATRIQSNLKALTPDTAYPSGYRDWNGTGWVDAKVKNPAFAAPAPAQVGVPVVTLLGGYNPANPAQSVLYPAFRSNYGNVFDLPAPDTGDSATRRCWVEVTHVGGDVDRMAISSTDGVKQVNINVAQSAQPSQARILCKQGTVEQVLQTIPIATNLPAMQAPVVIGQGAGYSALRAVEIPELDAKLAAYVGQARPVLDETTRVLLDSWSADLSGLSLASRDVAAKAEAVRRDAAAVNAFVVANRAALVAGTGKARTKLKTMLDTAGFVESATQVLPAGGRVTVDGGKCLAVDGATTVLVTGTAGECVDQDAQRWYLDARGAIHSAVRPDLCMGAATPVTLYACDPRGTFQTWTHQADGHLASKSEAGRYLDLYRSTGRPGLYGFGTGTNQLWTGLPTSANTGLAVLSADTIEVLSFIW